MATNEHGLEPTLTPKQEAFCHAYIECLNGTKAAIQAGYAAESAAVQAHENLRKPNIQARLAILRKERAEAEGLEKEDLLGFYKNVMIADVADLVGEDGKILNVKQLPHAMRQAISSVEVSKHGVKITLVDKKWAADKYAAHLGMNPIQKLEIKHDFEDLTDEALAARAAERLAALKAASSQMKGD